MRRRQVQWKELVAGVPDRGLYEGVRRDYLFTEQDWALNLLPCERSTILDYVHRTDVALHPFVHHVMSSQVFAFHLGAPFLEHPARLTPVLRRLLPPELADSVRSVTRVELEYDGENPGFGEPTHGRRGELRTSVDLAVWWEDHAARTSLLLIEVKFAEPGFGSCSKGRDAGGRCDTDGVEIVRHRGHGCPLTRPPFRRRYWSLAEQHELFRWPVLAHGAACPFRHHGYQLMRNQLMASVLEADPDRHLQRVDFVALVHDQNPSIRKLSQPMGGSTDVVDGWRAVLTDPSRFHWWPASHWLDALASTPELADWLAQVRGRYFSEVVGAAVVSEV